MTNSHILKITGSAELPEPLQIENSYKILIQADIQGIAKKSNNDGGFDYIYNAQQQTAELLSEEGKVIKTKDRKTQSKKLRDQIYFIRLDYAPDEDEEVFYERVMGAVRHNLVDMLKKEQII